MALFDSYLSECHEALLGASSRLREAEAASPRSRRPLLSLATSSIETAKHTLPLLELEARALPPHAKQEVRAVRSELSELKGRVKMLRNGADTSDCLREELFASHASGESSECASMLRAHERIASGTDRLKEVNAATLDMESTANSILGDLASQASTLQAGVEVSPVHPCLLSFLSRSLCLLFLFLLFPSSPSSTSSTTHSSAQCPSSSPPFLSSLSPSTPSFPLQFSSPLSSLTRLPIASLQLFICCSAFPPRSAAARDSSPRT